MVPQCRLERTRIRGAVRRARDGNTNPKRLFLDPEIDEGILNEVIPLTIMMNGACTKDMWERIMEVNAEPGEEVEKGVHE